MQYVFNVFGRLIAICRDEDRWSCSWMGADGKRRPVELVVPEEITRDELGQYLYDIYHESATPTHGDVFEVGRQSRNGAQPDA